MTTWVNVEGIKLSEIASCRKANTARSHLHSYVESHILELTLEERKMLSTRGWGEGKWGEFGQGYNVSVTQDE